MKHGFFRRLLLSITILMFFSLSMCEASPKLSKNKLVLKTGNVTVLKLLKSNQTASWSVTNKRILQIKYVQDNKVVVKARKHGIAQVIAKVGSKKYKSTITIQRDSAFPRSKKIFEGDKIKLKLPSAGKWSVSKKGIITLSKARGKYSILRAVKAGKVIVTAKVGKKKYKCKVTVIGKMDANPISGQQEISFPKELTGSYAFGSGSGAWGSALTIFEDGTFSAKYSHTSNFDSGDGYDYTVHTGNGSGKMSIIKRISELCYEMKVEYYKSEKEIGTTWIQDRCRYVVTCVPGFEPEINCIAYLSGSPKKTLPEDVQKNGGILLGYDENERLVIGFIYINGIRYAGP